MTQLFVNPHFDSWFVLAQQQRAEQTEVRRQAVVSPQQTVLSSGAYRKIQSKDRVGKGTRLGHWASPREEKTFRVHRTGYKAKNHFRPRNSRFRYY